jgi:hypothetical protein
MGRLGIFSTISESQIEFLMLQSLPQEKSSMFCDFFHKFFPVDSDIKEIIDHLDNRNFIDILQRKTQIMKKIKLVYMLKDCDFFNFKSLNEIESNSESSEKKTSENEKEETKDVESDKGEKEVVESDKNKFNESNTANNTSVDAILKFIDKKEQILNSKPNRKKNKFLINQLLKNKEDHIQVKSKFHYKIKKLNMFFNPKKASIKRSLKKISSKIEKNMRYNNLPNIYSNIIHSMEESIESLPPQIEFINGKVSNSVFTGIKPENERLPANEETILPFNEIEDIANMLKNPNQNPYYEILPLGIEPF